MDPAPKPAKLAALEEDPLYKDFLNFYPNRNPPHGFADISLPVVRLQLVSSGHSNGHWFLCFFHDNQGHSRTYVNCKAVLLNDYSQLWVGGLDWSSNWHYYELAVNDPHRHLPAFIYALLHPTASVTDGVHEDKPMLWYRYYGGGRTAGCRHWTESAARAFWGAGFLSGEKYEVNAKIAEEGDRIELENTANPKGKFLDHRPPEADYKMPVLKD